MRKINRLANEKTRIDDFNIENDCCYFWPTNGFSEPTHIGLKDFKIGYFICNQKGIEFKSRVKRLFRPIPKGAIGVKFVGLVKGKTYGEVHWLYE